MNHSSGSHFQALVQHLHAAGNLVLVEGALPTDLPAPIDLEPPEAWMDWLMELPQVEELFIEDEEFSRAFFRVHPAAPAPGTINRNAGCGMVVRAYELLGEVLDRTMAGRRHVLFELAPPELYVRAEIDPQALLDEECEALSVSLDPLELGEVGAEALDPTEYEVLEALCVALERPLGSSTVRLALEAAGIEAQVVGTEGTASPLSLSAPVAVGTVARALRLRPPSVR